MNNSILNIEIQEFINSNINTNINTLALKGTEFKTVTTREIITQIEAKKRCQDKLPTWFNTKGIYYPNKLNIEQTSSEVTAKYKSELIKGTNVIDITGGFGVDCLYFSKRFKNVVHCETNPELSDIAKHNYQQLQAHNITTINIDGIQHIKTHKENYDWMYIDPSRRHDTKGKVFFLKDCIPNVPKHLELLLNRTKHLMVKTSPLLDISIGLNEFQYVKNIYIVAVNNEVKELLWCIEKNYQNEITVTSVNLKKTATETFSYNFNDEKQTVVEYSKPLNYLYEPNTAILKSGGFNQIAKKFNVFKLHQHSHLYTSETLIDFPGRIFKIQDVIPYSKKELKRLKLTKVNITTRNFPENVAQLRKKYGFKDGGSTYLFFTTDMDNNKIVLVTSK
ncbi:hypothetical protein MHTCC0001_32130 [Flavobacteriaceae bacterium MHTCC 0001]